MDETLRQQYLEAMGIRTWVPRPPTAPVAEVRADTVSTAAPETKPVAVLPAASEQGSKPVAPAAISLTMPETDSAESNSLGDIPPQWLDEIPPPLEEYSPTAPLEAPAFNLEPGVHSIASLGWDELRQRVSQCEACPLHKNRTQPVFGEGDSEADLMIIGDAPSPDDDRKGAPFEGPAGTLLDAMLRAIGFKRNQVFIANLLKCLTPDNRDPHADEVHQCEAYLKRQVALVKPKVILVAGRVAAQKLLVSTEPVGKLRGKQASYEGVPVIVTYHPAYLLRSPEHKAKSWKDLQRLVGELR